MEESRDPCGDPTVWNQTEPEPATDHLLNLCFLRTTGVWLPPLYLWVLGPIYLLYIHRHGKGYLRMSLLFKTRMVLGLALILLCTSSTAVTLWRIHQGAPQALEHLIHPTVWLTTMSLALFLIHEERKKGVQASGLLFGYWLLCCLFPVISIIQQAQQGISQSDPFPYLSTYLYLCLVVTQFVLSCFADQPPFFPKEPRQPNPCPEAGASFPSKIMFWWVSGLVWKGYRKLLEPEDLWSLSTEYCSEELVSQLQKEWIRCHSAAQRSTERTVFKRKGGPKMESPETEAFLQQEGSKRSMLLRAIWKVYRSSFLLATLIIVICDVFRFMLPKLLRVYEGSQGPSLEGLCAGSADVPHHLPADAARAALHVHTQGAADEATDSRHWAGVQKGADIIQRLQKGQLSGGCGEPGVSGLAAANGVHHLPQRAVDVICLARHLFCLPLAASRTLSSHCLCCHLGSSPSELRHHQEEEPLSGRADETEGLPGTAYQLRDQERADTQVPRLGGGLPRADPAHAGPGAGCPQDLRPPLLRVSGVLPSVHFSDGSGPVCHPHAGG